MFPYNRFCLILIFLFLIGCKHVTEPVQTVYGLYKSSIFIEPGSADGGVDIQSSGGYLQIGLSENKNFTATLFIPENVSSNYPKGISTYEGKFTINDDTIEFTSSGFILEKIQWKKESEQLETFEVPPRGRPFKIVLNKKSVESKK